MELVYLWIEDYKNIKKQGFNFSPKFDFQYDGREKNLTIKPQKYVNIFPDNFNVTVIVGENGSAKSALLEYMVKNFYYYFYSDEGEKESYYYNFFIS